MRTKKLRITGIVFLLFLLMGCLSGYSFAETESWDGKTADTGWYEENQNAVSYTIETPAQLAGLAAIVNGTAEGLAQDDFQGQEICLGADLDLRGEEWTPIGTAKNSASGSFVKAESAAFQGTFDGKGHKIENLKISDSEDGAALFGYIGTDSSVKELTVSGAVSAENHAAGIAAVAGGVIENVTNCVDVTVAGNYAGGICSQDAGTLRITSCGNTGTINQSSRVESTGRMGGIIGCADSGAHVRIEKCFNTGDITGYQYIGGIIGGQFGDADVDACFNTGGLTGISFGKVYLGGIVGKSQGGTITNCYNRGDIYDAHWAAGNIRAVGGIAGCEEGRTSGTTAITNCYTTGSIDANTSNMEEGSNFIYEVGNISGGNSTTSKNGMKYENCYYLENRIAFADKSHAGYIHWADVYKADPGLWDTEYITKKTDEEMKSAGFPLEVGDAFVEDSDNENGGYPILYWQAGLDEPQPSYEINAAVYGDEKAGVSIQKSARAGDSVDFSITDLASGKSIQKIVIADVSGKNISYTKNSESWEFTMPQRNVFIEVYIGTEPRQDARAYSVQIDPELDGIWSLDVESDYETDGKISEGATVLVTVKKDSDAQMTSLEGITVSGAEETEIACYKETKDSLGNGVTGVYAFPMPGRDITISPKAGYQNFTISVKEGAEGETKAVKTYSRADMLELAEKETLYFSGYASDTEAFIGKAEQAVTLTALLADSGLSKYCKEGTVFQVYGVDNMYQTYTYDTLYGTQRYYYPNIIKGGTAEKKAEGKVAVDMMLTIKSYMASQSDGDVEEKRCDTLMAYRFVFGQTEKEFNQGIPSVENKANSAMPKCVNGIVLIVDPEQEEPSTEPAKPTTEPTKPEQKAPAAPSTAKAARASYNSVTVSWSKVSSADGYEVYRAKSKAGAYSRIAKVASASKVKYTNKSLATGTTYYYKVRAYRVVDGTTVYSGFSKVVSAKPTLSKTTVTLKAGKKRAQVKWKKVTGASGYQVYRSLKKTKSFKKVKTITKGSTVKYTNKKLKKGKRYYYKVRAYRNVGGKKVYGAYSAVKSVKVK